MKSFRAATALTQDLCDKYKSISFWWNQSDGEITYLKDKTKP